FAANLPARLGRAGRGGTPARTDGAPASGSARRTRGALPGSAPFSTDVMLGAVDAVDTDAAQELLAGLTGHATAARHLRRSEGRHTVAGAARSATAAGPGAPAGQRAAARGIAPTHRAVPLNSARAGGRSTHGNGRRESAPRAAAEYVPRLPGVRGDVPRDQPARPGPRRCAAARRARRRGRAGGRAPAGGRGPRPRVQRDGARPGSPPAGGGR